MDEVGTQGIFSRVFEKVLLVNYSITKELFLNCII
jgi:hypothetical protein